jgi:sugar O-acyltransferase (sialic acid O-acetyltransferase NeuD family)
MTQTGVIIVGASGHGKIVLSVLLASNHKVWGFLDDNVSLHGTKIGGYEVLGSVNLLQQFSYPSAILAIGVNKTRKKLAKELLNVTWINAIHPRAYVHETVKIGVGSIICAGATIQPDSTVGRHVIVNTSASVDHDSVLEDFVHIAPASHLAGGVHVAEGAFVGMHSAVLPGVDIGAWTMIAAGSVVTKSVSPGAVVKGIPAKIYKKNFFK